MWADGGMHGCFAWPWEGDFFHHYIPDRGVFIAYGMALDGVPEDANLRDYFRVVPDYLGSDNRDCFYRDTSIAEKDAESEGGRVRGRYNIIYTRACVKKATLGWVAFLSDVFAVRK